MLLQKNRELHSLRCNYRLKMAVALANIDEPELYYPHNVDFRGRAYTVHPHLNHLGSDSCRGLLTFVEARPLGASGLRWLRIHVANLFAGTDAQGLRVDKQSLAAREQWTRDNMHLVRDSGTCTVGGRWRGRCLSHGAPTADTSATYVPTAEQPLAGQRWWLQAEDPWQFLAACFELIDAERSPDPGASCGLLCCGVLRCCRRAAHTVSPLVPPRPPPATISRLC